MKLSKITDKQVYFWIIFVLMCVLLYWSRKPQLIVVLPPDEAISNDKSDVVK